MTYFRVTYKSAVRVQLHGGGHNQQEVGLRCRSLEEIPFVFFFPLGSSTTYSTLVMLGLVFTKEDAIDGLARSRREISQLMDALWKRSAGNSGTVPKSCRSCDRHRACSGLDHENLVESPLIADR